MVFRGDDVPQLGVNLGEKGIGMFGQGVDVGEAEAVGQRERSGIDGGTADDEDFLADGGIEGSLEGGKDFGVGPGSATGAGEDEVAAVGQSAFGEGLKSAASHDDGVAGGEGFEALEVSTNRIEEAVLKADGIVLSQGADEGDHDGGGDFLGAASDGHGGSDVGMRGVVNEAEVGVVEIEDARPLGVEAHSGQGARGAAELLAGLLDVVEVEVGVASGVDQFTGSEAAHLCHHQGEQGIGGNVEGNAQESVGRALVEETGESAIGDVELEEDVAGWEGHFVDIGHVPGADNHAPAVGSLSNLLHDFFDLVDVSPFAVGP